MYKLMNYTKKKHLISIKNNQLSKTTFEVLNFIIGTASLFILFSHLLSRNLSRILFCNYIWSSCFVANKNRK